jgi:hypothetical protein
MNLENFKEVYLKTISESADDSDLKNWIRSIVEEVISESISEGSEDMIKKLLADIKADNKKRNELRKKQLERGRAGLEQGKSDLEKIGKEAETELDSMLGSIAIIARDVDELIGTSGELIPYYDTFIKALQTQIDELKRMKS